MLMVIISRFRRTIIIRIWIGVVLIGIILIIMVRMLQATIGIVVCMAVGMEGIMVDMVGQ